MLRTPPPQPEYSGFQAHYLGAVRGWDRFAHAQNPDAERIIDIDVGPELAPYEYTRIEDIRSDLENLAGDVPADEPDREVLEQTARSNVMFLRALTGEKPAFEDYVEGTLGFRPVPLAPGAIKESAQRLDEVLRYGGLRLRGEFAEKYDAEHVMHDIAKMKAAFSGAAIAVEKSATRYLGDVPALGIDPEYVSDDTFGVSEITQRPDRSLRWGVNLLPEKHPMDLGRVKTIAAHELAGHAVHITLLDGNISAGRINPALGPLGMHMPFSFQAEALAQNAEFMFTDDEWHNTWRALYNQHMMMVFYDAQWQANHGEDPKAIADNIASEELLPFTPEAYYSEDFVAAMRDDPLFRTYFTAYYPSAHAMEPLRAGEDPDKRQQTLSRLYSTAVTPRELTDLVTTSQE